MRKGRAYAVVQEQLGDAHIGVGIVVNRRALSEHQGGRE